MSEKQLQQQLILLKHEIQKIRNEKSKINELFSNEKTC